MSTDQLRSALTLPTIALLAFGCSSSPAGPPVEPAIASINLTFQSYPIVVGRANRVLATVRDSAGVLLDPGDYSLTWSVSDSTIADIGPEGSLIPKRIGTATVTAAAGSVVATIPFSNSPSAATAYEIAIVGSLQRVGDRASVRGYTVDAFGNRIREVGVYCSCYQDDGSVARYRDYEVVVVGVGQFLLSIDQVVSGASRAVKLFDIRE